MVGSKLEYFSKVKVKHYGPPLLAFGCCFNLPLMRWIPVVLQRIYTDGDDLQKRSGGRGMIICCSRRTLSKTYPITLAVDPLVRSRERRSSHQDGMDGAVCRPIPGYRSKWLYGSRGEACPGVGPETKWRHCGVMNENVVANSDLFRPSVNTGGLHFSTWRP